MTLIGITVTIFNLLLWTVIRETLIEKNKASAKWAGIVVAGCAVASFASLMLLGA